VKKSGPACGHRVHRAQTLEFFFFDSIRFDQSYNCGGFYFIGLRGRGTLILCSSENDMRGLLYPIFRGARPGSEGTAGPSPASRGLHPPFQRRPKAEMYKYAFRRPPPRWTCQARE